MSNAEPPSRIPPRGINPETKAARDEIMGKIEKVREIDADDARKRFQKYYGPEQQEEDEETENRPSPFDLYSGKTPPMEGAQESLFSGFSDVEDAIVANPSYTPPPNFSSFNAGGGEEDDEATTNALPQSEDFWEDALPDQPILPKSLQESQASEQPSGGKKTSSQEKGKKEEDALAPGNAAATKKKQPSPFDLPGKGVIGPATAKGKAAAASSSSEAAKKNRPAALDGKTAESAKKGEKNIAAAPFSLEKGAQEKKKEGKESSTSSFRQQAAAAKKTDEKEEEGSGKGKREQKITEINISSLPPIPLSVQPTALTATEQAAPYIRTATVALFYQMVGTMYVVAATPGISRTEIVLNNPAYANSKFFGATIRIEKYAIAPDSFNIVLTGSNEAVVAFKENIPSLMTAFQNGHFSFKVNRLDVEYAAEKPLFRRKEGVKDSGDFGENGG